MPTPVFDPNQQTDTEDVDPDDAGSTSLVSASVMLTILLKSIWRI